MHVAEHMKSYRLPENRKEELDNFLEELMRVEIQAKNSIEQMNDKELSKLLNSDIYEKLPESLKEYAKEQIKK